MQIVDPGSAEGSADRSSTCGPRARDGSRSRSSVLASTERLLFAGRPPCVQGLRQTRPGSGLSSPCAENPLTVRMCAAGETAKLRCAMSFSIGQWVGVCRLAPQALATGCYLTDGSRLFRVASRFEAGREVVLVALEDCSTFEVKALLPSALRAMGLRAVRVARWIETEAANVSPSCECHDGTSTHPSQAAASPPTGRRSAAIHDDLQSDPALSPGA